MNHIVKFIGFLMLFILVFIYCIKSIYSYKISKDKLDILLPEYVALLKESQELSLELNTLQYKVNGIRENSLNKDILEERVKTMLNLKNSDEILLIN